MSIFSSKALSKTKLLGSFLALGIFSWSVFNAPNSIVVSIPLSEQRNLSEHLKQQKVRFQVAGKSLSHALVLIENNGKSIGVLQKFQVAMASRTVCVC